MNDKKIRISNCPKCNSKAQYTRVLSNEHDFVVYYPKCNFTYEIYKPTIRDAIRAWNTMVYTDFTNK